MMSASQCTACGHFIDNHTSAGCGIVNCLCTRTHRYTDHPRVIDELATLRDQLASEKAETERFRALAENQTEAVKTYMAQLATANAELARVEKERDEAREWVRRITQDARTLACAFCGYAYPPGTPTSNHESLLAHIKQCPKHPLAMDLVEVRADLDICMDALEHLSHIGNFTTTLHSNICEAGRHEIEARIEYANEWKKKTRQWQTADKETNDDATAPEGD